MIAPLDTRQPWWPFLAAGAAGTCWEKGRPVRALIKPGSGVLRATGGAAMELTAPLIAVRLDYRALRSVAPTSPGMRGRVQTALADRLRGSRLESGRDEEEEGDWE